MIYRRAPYEPLFSVRASFYRPDKNPHRRAAQFVDESLDALIAGCEALAIHQVLPDPRRIPAARKSEFDRFAIWLARTCRGAATGPCSLVAVVVPVDSAPKSVVTCMAGFAGARRPHPPGGRRGIPAARR
jgi:hypothetical protein